MSKDIDRKIIRLRKQKKGYKTIATALGVDRDRVRYVCQRQGLAGIMAETEAHECKEKKFKRDFENKFPGFNYHSGFQDRESPFYCKCRICGHIQERNAQCVKPSRCKELQCDNCNELIKLRKELIITLRNINDKKVKEQNNIIKENERIKELTGICRECGKVFIGTSKGMMYCSTECANRKHNRIKEIRKRKRLKKNGDIDWNITLNKLIKRDKNVCHMCGDRCDKKDYRLDSEGNFIVGPDYPSIDHVLPISKGGTHTWSNVKLAHHYCNTIKSDNEIYVKGNGQLTLTM